MSKIIGATVGTPTSVAKIEHDMKPVKTVNGNSPDENGNVEIPTGGDSSGGGYSKTVLWQWAGGLSFRIGSLSLDISGYDALEIVYKLDCYENVLATSGEILMPTSEYPVRCFLLSSSGSVNTTVNIASDGTFTFTLKDDELGAPWEIYGIKHSSSGDSGEVSYTNVLDSVGYQTDKYIDLGDEEAKAGVDLTGRIAVKVGDIIRLKNVTMPDVEGYENKVYGYKSGGSYARAVSVLSTGTEHSPVFENGNLVQFTVTNYILNAGVAEKGYIRIGAANIDTKSIITVNEVID